MKICKVENCQKKHYSKGFCQKHYQQMKKYGKILKRTRKDKNEIIDCGDYCKICLYKKNKEVTRTKIDKKDLEKVKNYKWWINGSYVNSGTNGKYISLHQLILGEKDGLIIDHINHDTLDNRKQNLRHCTHQQNMMNNKMKGYCWRKENKKWRVEITINHKRIHLGHFVKEQDAINVRKKAEQKYFKEFAYNN